MNLNELISELIELQEWSNRAPHASVIMRARPLETAVVSARYDPDHNVVILEDGE